MPQILRISFQFNSLILTVTISTNELDQHIHRRQRITIGETLHGDI